jgi:hypothetical protein
MTGMRTNADPGVSPGLGQVWVWVAGQEPVGHQVVDERVVGQRRDLQRLTSHGLPDLEDQDVMRAAWQR